MFLCKKTSSPIFGTGKKPIECLFQAKAYASLMRRRRAEFDDTIVAETDPYTAKHASRLGYVTAVFILSLLCTTKRMILLAAMPGC